MPAAVELIGRLATVYAQAGLHERALSTALPSDFMARFEASLSAPWFPWPAAGDRVRFVRTVAGLVERDLSLPCSLGHGDMSISNVIRDEQDVHWLIDWKQGGRMPVAFDVRKLLLTTGAPDAVHERITAAIRPFEGDGVRRYQWRHQLALGVCKEMTVAPRHRAGSLKRGRLPQFEAKLQARLAWAMALLS